MITYALHTLINGKWVTVENRIIPHLLNIGDYLELSIQEQKSFFCEHVVIIAKLVNKHNYCHLYIKRILHQHPENIIKELY